MKKLRNSKKTEQTLTNLNVIEKKLTDPVQEEVIELLKNLLIDYIQKFKNKEDFYEQNYYK